VDAKPPTHRRRGRAEGGHRRAARLRSESVIEVEQAALTAASPPPAAEPARAHPAPAATCKTPEDDHEKLHA
jgi:hypothetical protein